MSKIRKIVEQAAADLTAKGISAAEIGNGVWKVAVDEDEVTVAAGEDDGDVVCYATVGSFANVSEKDLLLEDALKANCFWDETYGATLSVDPETGALVLADRQEADFVDGDQGLEAYLSQFLGVLRSWKRYVANCSPGGVPSGEGRVSSPLSADLDAAVDFGQVMRILP